MLSSGIDIASILNRSEENLHDENNDDSGYKKNSQNSSSSLKSMDKTSEMINNEKNLSKDNGNVANEQNVLLNELEATSKGKVKGSLIMNYLNSAKRPFSLIFIVITFLMAQTLASLADIWVSYW